MIHLAIFVLGVLGLFLAAAGVVYLAVRLGAVIFRALEKARYEDQENGDTYEASRALRRPDRRKGA
jgi:hypothetical protein